MTVLTSTCTTLFESDDHEVTSVAVAREAISRWLGSRGASEELHDTVLLVASELVTNAVRNTDGVVRVTVGEVLGGVKLQVFDESPHLPTPRVAGSDDTSGRGLAIVDALADAWSAHHTIGDDQLGKVVWATFRCDDRC